MKYRRTVHFKKDYQSLPGEIQDAARKAFLLFKLDPRHPSLRVKKMERFKEIWEGHITLGYVFTYVFTFHWDSDTETGEPIAVFRRIGKHDDVYDKP